MEPQRFSAKDKADRVWREKRGLHDYVQSSSVIAPSPVSGLVHEDYVPRHEPSSSLSSVIAPSPVSGLVHEEHDPRDEPSIPLSSVVAASPVSGMVQEDPRYPNVLPHIFGFLWSDERRMPLQVSIAWWREVNIGLAMLRTKARHPYIQIFLGSRLPVHWEIVTRECVTLMRRSRPHVIGPNFKPSIRGGRYHEC